ncbi:MAG: hypothetical protein ACK557_02700, partial [Planctomycetota bacterium]
MYGLIEGAIVPLSSANIPLWDLGFAQGVAVTEQLRTLGQELWLLDSHLDRLEQGLRIAWLEWPEVLGANPRQELAR